MRRSEPKPRISTGEGPRPLTAIMPWAMVTPIDPASVPTSLALALGLPVPSITPVMATAVCCIVFMVVALWRFGREEF